MESRNNKVRFPADMRFRRIAFTVWDYNEDDIQSILNNDHFKYVFFGEEVSEEGRPHLLGYGEFYKKVHIKTIHKEIHPTMHVEERYASQAANITYCSKQKGKTYERGQRCHQGCRPSLLDIQECVDNHASDRSIRERYVVPPSMWRKVDRERVLVPFKRDNVEVIMVL